MGERGRELCALRVVLMWAGPLGPMSVRGTGAQGLPAVLFTVGPWLTPSWFLACTSHPGHTLPALPLAIAFTSQLRPQLPAR